MYKYMYSTSMVNASAATSENSVIHKLFPSPHGKSKLEY